MYPDQNNRFSWKCIQCKDWLKLNDHPYLCFKVAVGPKAWCPFDRYDRYDRCDRSKAVNLYDRWTIAESCPFNRSNRSKKLLKSFFWLEIKINNQYCSAPWEIWRSFWLLTIAGLCPYDRCDRYDRWGDRWNRTWSYSSDRDRYDRHDRWDGQQWCVHLIAVIADRFFSDRSDPNNQMDTRLKRSTNRNLKQIITIECTKSVIFQLLRPLGISKLAKRELIQWSIIKWIYF